MHFLKQPAENSTLASVEAMKLLVTGSTGFVGRHFLQSRLLNSSESEDFSVVTLPSNSLDLLMENAAQIILEKVQPTHVLHLAWASTASASYDEGESHERWYESTLAMISHLSDFGVVSWGIGTGLESDISASTKSAYGLAKLKLKKNVLELDNPLSRWISMPYIFSIYHERPRVIRSCMQSELLVSPEAVHDYLEIRDVAFQLAHTIKNRNERVFSISSGRKTSNSDFCIKVREKMTHRIFENCSCIDDSSNHREESPEYFTNLFLS